jgi:hypothetical protein
LLAQVRWFSPASSTTKTGRHDIAQILLKVALNIKKSINQFIITCYNLLTVSFTSFYNQIRSDEKLMFLLDFYLISDYINQLGVGHPTSDWI